MIEGLDHIETERLTLRALTPEAYAELFTHSREAVMRFLGHTADEDYEREKMRYEGGMRTFNKAFVYFQLIEKASQRVIGWCGFHTWYLDHNRAELGYGLLTDDVKRKGYMSEALPSVLEYGFSTMNLHRIEAMASPQNTPSIKLLESNHFTQEGLLREHYLKDGIYEDSAVYSLIRS